MARRVTHKTQRPIILLLIFTLQSALMCLAQDRNHCWTERHDSSSITYSCFGEGFCFCSNTTADCSSHHGLLTYVPRLPIDVQVLNFSSNNLSYIPNNFFFNVSRVWLLDLSNNGLISVSSRAFQGLHHLTTLFLNGNHLNRQALGHVFRIQSLLRLEILCSGLSQADLNIFSRSTLMELDVLNVSLNNIGSFYMGNLQPLNSLHMFIAQTNQLYNLTTSRLENLRFLDLQNNRLFDFPKSCDPDTGESLFPNLEQLLLDFNMISSITDPVCFPKLYVLTLEFNRFQMFESNTFGILRFPSLEKLELTQMEDKILRIDKFTFNNSQLLYLGLALNYLDLSSPRVLHEDAFGGSTGITIFYFDHCVFKTVSIERFHRLFEPFRSIKSLYLGDCGIESISPDTFAPFKSLEYLYLYGNLIRFLPDGCFSALTKLKVLVLNNNLISVISKDTFTQETLGRLQKIYLGGNPFYCSCDIRWFQEWMSSHPHQFCNYKQDGYMCDNILNTPVRVFQINDQACLLGQAAATFTVAVIIIVLVVFIISIVFFRFRWHLRLVMYEWFHHRGPQEGQLRHFTNDVFVGYAEEDRKWVMQELLPVLEGQWSLRACVHERDFIPGKHIVDNIADCVQDSRKILMVFSPDYARSEWCQFELKYCQCCVMDRDEVLVLVLLHETESRDMTSAMFAVMKTTTYIEWANTVDARDSFWGRLSRALNCGISSQRSISSI